jgi:hypothetical protein
MCKISKERTIVAMATVVRALPESSNSVMLGKNRRSANLFHGSAEKCAKAWLPVV